MTHDEVNGQEYDSHTDTHTHAHTHTHMHTHTPYTNTPLTSRSLAGNFKL